MTSSNNKHTPTQDLTTNEQLAVQVHRAADRLFENDLIDGADVRYDMLLAASRALRYGPPLENGLSAADYEEVLTDHRRLVRELDVLLNGTNAAPQASLCDIVSQVAKLHREMGRPHFGLLS
jgi:hypothetical protein